MPRFFGAKLRAARTQRGLTQAELARRIGLARHTHVTHMEAHRRTPSLALVVRAATVLHVTTDYLLRDDLPVEPVIDAPPDRADLVFPPQLLGDKVHALRSARALRQVDLTTHLQLASQGYISKIEAGQEPSPEVLVRIAQEFNVSTDALVRDDVPVDQVEGFNPVS